MVELNKRGVLKRPQSALAAVFDRTAQTLPVATGIVSTLRAWKKFIEVIKAFDNRFQNSVTIFYHRGIVSDERESDWGSVTST